MKKLGGLRSGCTNIKLLPCIGKAREVVIARVARDCVIAMIVMIVMCNIGIGPLECPSLTAHIAPAIDHSRELNLQFLRIIVMRIIILTYPCYPAPGPGRPRLHSPSRHMAHIIKGLFSWFIPQHY